MTNRLLTILLFLLAGCGNNANHKAAEPAPVTSPASSQQDQVVTKMVDSLHTALLNKNGALLQRLCSDGLSYGHSGGSIQDKQAFIEDVVNGSFKFLSINTEDNSVSIDGHLATARHTFLAHGVNKGDTVDIKIGNVMLFRENSSRHWQLVLRQAYKL